LLPIISPPINRPPLSCFRIVLRDGSKSRPKSGSEDSLAAGEDQALLCRVCSSVITKPEEAITKNGLHEHVFFNPTGITFELRCFGRAKGCSLQGEPTSAFTWFAGYSWQYAICSTCLTHLGWRFQSDNDCFWGLIGNRLIE
jgi:hypothetical protein